MRKAFHDPIRGANGSVALKVGVACALVVCITAAQAASNAAAKVQTCKDAQNHTIFADPTDPRCYKPPKTLDEQAADDDRKERGREAYRRCKVDQRDLQTLLSRYPDKDRHDAARHTALAELEASMAATQARMDQLLKDRKRLSNEAEFYPKGNLPPGLRRDIEANVALIVAQTLTIENQKRDAAQKNAFYDEQLAKLRKLWQQRPGDTRPCVAPAD